MRDSTVLKQFAEFLLVGLSNAVVDLGTLNLLLLLKPSHNIWMLLVDNTFAVALAILNSYAWNTRFTFRAHVTRQTRQRMLFVAQACLNVVINNLVLLGLSSMLAPASGLSSLLANNIAKLGAMVMASTTSFLLLRTVVFRPQDVVQPSEARPSRMHHQRSPSHSAANSARNARI